MHRSPTYLLPRHSLLNWRQLRGWGNASDTSMCQGFFVFKILSGSGHFMNS